MDVKRIHTNLTLLTTDTIQKIAIANPKTCSLWKSEHRCIESIIGIYERVKHKLVFGESISQVNQFITTGSADIGFTAYSVVSYRNENNWKVDIHQFK